MTILREDKKLMEFARSSTERRKEQSAKLPQEKREKVLAKLESKYP